MRTFINRISIPEELKDVFENIAVGSDGSVIIVWRERRHSLEGIGIDSGEALFCPLQINSKKLRIKPNDVRDWDSIEICNVCLEEMPDCGCTLEGKNLRRTLKP